MPPSEVPIDETDRLIASNKVEGTTVYNRNHDKLASIYNVMLDKATGETKYAVLTFGGLSGVGSDYYPLPWQILTYDTNQRGYVVDLDKSKLETAPRYRPGDEPRYDTAYDREVQSYYGLPIG